MSPPSSSREGGNFLIKTWMFLHICKNIQVVWTYVKPFVKSPIFKVIALRRMVDMMNPGGVLLLRDLVYSFDPGEVEERIEAWLFGATDGVYYSRRGSHPPRRL